jgi:hypothetical protein
VPPKKSSPTVTTPQSTSASMNRTNEKRLAPDGRDGLAVSPDWG